MTMSFSTSGRSAARLPFRIVVLGAFSGTNAPPSAGPGGLKLHRVDGGSFDEVLSTVGPRLTLDLPEPLTLAFDSFKSLRPDGLVRQVPGGQERMIVRQSLTQLRNRKIGGEEAVTRVREAPIAEDLRSRLLAALGAGAAASGAAVPSPSAPAPAVTPPSPSPSAPPRRPDSGSDDDALGGLLSMVDVPGAGGSAPPPPAAKTPPPPDPAASAISAVIGSIAGGGRAAGGPSTAEAAAALEILDASLAADVTRVLHDPGFRRFEAAWRGLRFLVGRIDFREGITLEIADAVPAACVDALRALAFDRAAGALPGDPVSLVVGAWELPLDAAALEPLGEAARAAESLEAPFVTGADPGGDDPVVATPGWDAFRAQPWSAWLGLAINPFLLRLPFGAETEPARDFDYEEPDTEPLWGSPALAVAALAARAHARLGWPTLFEGRDAALEDLPVHSTPSGDVPTRAALSPDEVTALAAAGFIPLAATAGRDQVFVVRAPAAARDSSLAYRLAQGRLVALIRRSLHEAAGPDPETLKAAAAKALTALGLPPNDIETVLGPAAGGPGDVRKLTVRCRPGPPILPAARDIELNFLV